MNKRDLDTKRANTYLKIKKVEDKIDNRKTKIKKLENEIQSLEKKKELLKDELIANEGHFHKDYSGVDD
ncbi:MAG: hypothetical protein ACOC1K_01800 [Nanoarchaeota archaeon]